MSTLVASVFGLVTTIVAILGLIFGHKIGARDKAQEVALAKDLTERETRQRVADETAAAAQAAKTEATSSRQASDAEARATASQGSSALDDALKAQGQLRD